MTDRTPTEEKDLLATMRSRLEVAMTAYSSTRENQLEDQKFMAGSPDNQWQWPADILRVRGAQANGAIAARPCLTVNKLPQHVRMITNDQKQNRPSGKVIPVDDNGDPEIAELLNGIIRHIEYISDADVAYDTACELQVTSGEGYWRILTDYSSPDSFDQDILIRRIRNSFSVYMDPLIQEPDGSDQKWCLLSTDLAHDQYERDFPDASPVSTLEIAGRGDQGMKQWIGEHTVRIAEYFFIDYEKKTLNQYDDGSTAFDGSDEAKAAEAAGLKVIKSRPSQKETVRWIKTNGADILEENVWPGRYIPVIRVVGNEYEIEGELHVSGLVRNAKDPQRMINYWKSQEAEMLALAPKAPFIGYAGQFEGFEQQWKTANTTNWPYLEVNPDIIDAEGSPVPLPQRSSPPQAQQGLILAAQGADEDLKSVTGQYNASIGMASNERSGKAIIARERQGDTGTYHYVDNLARAIRHSTRQIVDLIPKIYDTKRVARIIGLDGQVDMAQIDPNQQQAVVNIVDEQGAVVRKIFNPSVGKYDVMVATGPGYMTKRQEALDAMSQILQTNPQLWPVIGDLLVRNMDWPGAQEMAERLKKTLDPRVLSNEDPQVQHLQQQLEMMTQELQQSAQAIADFKRSTEANKVFIDEAKVQIAAFDAETKRLAAINKAPSNLTPEMVQEIVMGVLHSAASSGDILTGGLMQLHTEIMQNEAPPQPPMGAQPAQGMPPAAAPGGGAGAPGGGSGDGGGMQLPAVQPADVGAQ